MAKKEQHIPLAELGDYTELSDPEMKETAARFYEQIKTRHSIRMFATDPVPEEVISACVQAAGTAPSGANHQPWHFAIVKDPAIKKKIRFAAEEEERAFYEGRAGQEWLDALAPIGTDANKQMLEDAP